MNLMPSSPEMEKAFLAGDASYDGVFWTGVRTTGIFCRPSCSARKPKRENIEFFGSVKEAMFAGYRACRRCHPLETDGRPPEWVDKLLKTIDGDPEARLGAAQLRELGVEPVKARRWFQQHYGMTFTAFCRARRLQRAFSQLRNGEELDEVALGNGFDSHSGFRDAFGRVFGTPPGKSRGGDCITTAMIESPVGPLVAGVTEQGVCLLEFTDRRMLEGQLETLKKRLKLAAVPGERPLLAQLRSELAAYFEGKLQQFQVPLLAPGTEFQERVWAELCRIPYGETVSYEELAQRTGRPGAQRAAGHANGLNRLAIVIPCHRVVNKDGELGGYGGGLWRKRLLLDLERKHKKAGAPVTPSN